MQGTQGARMEQSDILRAHAHRLAGFGLNIDLFVAGGCYTCRPVLIEDKAINTQFRLCHSGLGWFSAQIDLVDRIVHQINGGVYLCRTDGNSV